MLPSVASSTMMTDAQRRFSQRMKEVRWCAKFPAPDAVEMLAARSIDVRQLPILVDCLAMVGRSWDFRESKQMVDDESLIAIRARELIELLGRIDHDNGWRHVWDMDYEKIESSVEIDQLVDDLEALARSASQRLEEIRVEKIFGLQPQSGKVRYFYWMSLITFWNFVLSREVKASDNGKNRPSGPLVAFVSIMSAGMKGPTVTPGAIRKFVKRHRFDIDKFARNFLPQSVVQLHYFASGRYLPKNF
ncbi:hypothetical protein [Mesorhizobium sp. LjNodule214]|uniref:hypothetical protein n=1 Tax=Mesorhizobium sp. LjNodule214 TaxID=3342252 RepID=UPI003ED14643